MLRLHDAMDALNREVDAAVSKHRGRDSRDSAAEKLFEKVRTRLRTSLRKAADQRNSFSGSRNGRVSFLDFVEGFKLGAQLGDQDILYAVLMDDAVMFWKSESLLRLDALLEKARADFQTAKDTLAVKEVHES
jgi:hypothetical protein